MAMQQTRQGNDIRDIDFLWPYARFSRPMSRDSGEDRARPDVEGLGQCVRSLAHHCRSTRGHGHDHGHGHDYKYDNGYERSVGFGTPLPATGELPSVCGQSSGVVSGVCFHDLPECFRTPGTNERTTS